MLTYFPSYFSKRAILLYMCIVVAVFVLYAQFFMSWVWLLFGVVEVILFFMLSTTCSRHWASLDARGFVRCLWGVGLGLRVIYVLFSYLFYRHMTGNPFEFSAGDSEFYDGLARFGAMQLRSGHFMIYNELDRYCCGLQLSDSGYPIYLSVVYGLFFNSILVSRLIKALWSTWTVVLMYRIGQRHFSETTARMGAVFVLLMPNLIYYCGLQLKEVEMVFLTVAFVYQTDALLLAKRYTFRTMVLPILLIGSLFLFRTILGSTAVMAFVTALLFSDSHRLGFGKRLVVLIWIVLVSFFFMGSTLMMEVQRVWQGREDNQQIAMKWYAERKGGNTYAKYVSTAVFAPLIFTIPFPTMVETIGQENQRMIHGGNYVKNILSFFCIFALVLMFIRFKSWRHHLLPLSFLLFYLGVISMSAFAHSERFHQPSLPFLLLFAAFGVSEMRGNDKKWYSLWLMVMLVVCVGWNWFKLAGRGL